jgi:predicted O-methyltransferase YrrM
MRRSRLRSFRVRATLAWVAVAAGAALLGVFTQAVLAAVLLGTAVSVFTSVLLYRRLIGRLMPAVIKGRGYSERRTEALFTLHTLCRPPVAMPLMQGWALSADVIAEVLLRAQQFAEPTILECGSGASTVWLGLWLKRRGAGRMVSLESDAGFAAQVRAAVAQAGVEEFVQVVHAPLTKHVVDGREWTWYSLDQVQLASIDVLIVDGPPYWVHEIARYPAVPLLAPRLSDDAVVFLHDTDRPAEKRARALARRAPAMARHPDPGGARSGGRHDRAGRRLRRPIRGHETPV